MKRLLLIATAVTLLLAFVATQAFAERSYRAQFERRYVKTESTEPQDVSFKASVQRASCAVCHVSERSKKRNPYGAAVGKMLRETGKKNFPAALEKAEGVTSDPNNPNAPTFGELIKQGKLPAGE